jgi:hypothetical protein
MRRLFCCSSVALWARVDGELALVRRHGENGAPSCSPCNKEIAGRLGLSPKTVEAHVSELLRRSGSDSRAAVIAGFWTRG